MEVVLNLFQENSQIKKFMKYYFNWKSYWDSKSECGPLISAGRSGSSPIYPSLKKKEQKLIKFL